MAASTTPNVTTPNADPFAGIATIDIGRASGGSSTTDRAAIRAAGFTHCKAVRTDIGCHPGIASLTDADIASIVATWAGPRGMGVAKAAGIAAFALGYQAANYPNLRGTDLRKSAAGYRFKASAQTGRTVAVFAATGPAATPANVKDGTLAKAVRAAAYGWDDVYRSC